MCPSATARATSSRGLPRGGRRPHAGSRGESGSGKSTIASAAVGLTPIREGDIRVNGVSTVGHGSEAKQARRRIQMVFQDPFSALDPRMPIGDSIAEGLLAAGRPFSREQRRARVAELLQQVDLDPARAGELPKSFSGGQRQRITIARALAGDPEILIADEVTSALDVSVQSTVLNLLRDLQQRLGLTMLFISHNLAVVRYISDETAVMRHGRIVEFGETEALLSDPAEPYTRELLAAVPVLGERMVLDG
ncbi:ATP-binding cassette domain-containing protein [Microbacterium sp. NIBRBAC000506063]|uniref:ATP-binding cassette domain-containing protein n=1 Tax=Microbacterium sp. NIBRBAC000506063 TaxID=2734618 RepID=UPI001BB6BF16|nr:ATP-binding cassette domain-containing protein [Microbacterium sp. NIBRBAC000506063]QTV80613.1 ABC transporter ATP-binding protein [Microbacterium sp. NIBRBAC000506063]